MVNLSGASEITSTVPGDWPFFLLFFNLFFSPAVLRSSATPSPQDRDGRTSPSSLDGAAAPRDRDNYDPRINRPRRHQHDFRNPKLGKVR